MKNLSLAMAALVVAVALAPTVAAFETVAPPPVCVAPCVPPCYGSCGPDPCDYVTPCPPPPVCLTCPVPCGVVCNPPVCDLSDRSCHPEPVMWRCEYNGPPGGGLIWDTVRYAGWMELIACATAFSEANVALESTGDTTYFAYTQARGTADYLLGMTISFPGSFLRPVMDDVQDTAEGEAALACGYLLGPSGCAAADGPDGTCPADLPDMGGQVGAALAVTEAACAMAQGGASETATDAAAAAAVVTGAVGGVVSDVEGHAAGTLAATRAYAIEMEGNANNAGAVAGWAVQSWYTATCTFLFGACAV